MKWQGSQATALRRTTVKNEARNRRTTQIRDGKRFCEHVDWLWRGALACEDNYRYVAIVWIKPPAKHNGVCENGVPCPVFEDFAPKAPIPAKNLRGPLCSPQDIERLTWLCAPASAIPHLRRDPGVACAGATARAASSSLGELPPKLLQAASGSPVPAPPPPPTPARKGSGPAFAQGDPRL